MSEEITTVLRQPEVRDRILELGAEPVGEGLRNSMPFARVGAAKCGRVVHETGTTAD